MTDTERKFEIALQQAMDAMADITEIFRLAAKDCGVE